MLARARAGSVKTGVETPVDPSIENDSLTLEILATLPGDSGPGEDHEGGTPWRNARFPASPADPEAYREQARRVDVRFDGEARRRAAEAIRAPHPEGERQLRRVVEEGGFFVTTGQQPGLFTGPLYSIYKAMTAIRLARGLEVLLERPVAPLFWVASEDHDWAEVDHAALVDVENVLHTVSLDGVPGGGADRPLFRCPLEPDIAEVLDRFAALLPPSDFVDEDLALLREAYAPGRGMGEAFAHTLGVLLGPHGLLLTDAADPALKTLSLPLLMEEARSAEAGEAILSRSARELEEAGRGVQVPILVGGVNLFLEGPGGRERMYRDDGGFRLNRSGEQLTEAEFRRRVEADPAALSPNVLLRPVVESTVFPVLAYVAGPGEMAYWAQLREFFEHHGVPMPLVHPRHHVTLVEGKVRKVLDRYSLEPGDFHRPVHEVAAATLRDEIPDGVKRAMGEYRGAVARSAAALAEAVKEVDPTLKGPVDGARNQAFKALEEVERKVVQALKRRNDMTLEQLEKAAVHLFPGGRPQERVLNLFYYTARYGRGLLDDLLEACTPALKQEIPLPTPPDVG